MKATEIVEISTRVLERLSSMGDELNSKLSCEKMIFPIKENKDEKTHVTKKKRRISEQELRFMFVDEFLKRCKEGYYYSVETPTVEKYSFGETFTDIKVSKTGKSGSIDMTVFDIVSGIYNRNLNIEFKYANVTTSHIAKDILKLVNEKPNGAFIHLLDNTDVDSLCNSTFNTFTKKNGTGVLNKLNESFKFYSKWNGGDEKQITIVIMSLKQKALIYQTIKKGSTIVDKGGCDNILKISCNEWKLIKI